MDLLEQIKKGLEDSKVIRLYLVNKISYYDFLRYNEREKIRKTKILTREETDNIIEKIKYYTNAIEILTNTIKEIDKLGIKNYE